MEEYPRITIGEPASGAQPGRIVITGASGMVGSYLTGELISRGYRNITIMVRSLGSLQKIRNVWKAENYPYDPSDLDVAPFRPDDVPTVARIFEGADVVFNCAAAVAIGGGRREDIIANNVSIANTVSRAAIASKPGLLVHVSSVAALMPSEGGKVDARSLPGCGEKASGYAESKYLSELEIANAAAGGVKTVTVNPVTILGWGTGGQGSSAIIPLLAKGIPFYPTGITGWVDARDVARAMIQLSGCSAAPGKRFVLSSGNCSYKKFLAEGCRAAGKKTPRFYVPEKAARSASAVEYLWCKLSRRRRFITPEMVSILYGKHYYDGEGIKKYVNFEYSPLSSTIERLVRLYLDNRG